MGDPLKVYWGKRILDWADLVRANEQSLEPENRKGEGREKLCVFLVFYCLCVLKECGFLYCLLCGLG